MDFWHIAYNEWFDILDEIHKHILNENSTECRFLKDEQIFSPTPEPDRAYLLLEGLVSLYRLNQNGGQLTMGFAQPGQLFGELPIVGHCGRETFAMAMCNSTALSIPKKTLLKIIEEDKPAALYIMRTVAEASIRFQRRIEELVFKSVRARLASVFLELAEDFGQWRGDTVFISLSLTQTELAQLIGAARPSVNIALGEFQSEDVIKIERDGTYILQYNELKQIAARDLPRKSRLRT